MIDHHDVSGETIGLLEVLRGEQHRGARLDEGIDHIPEGEPALRVEPGGRLIEEEHRWRCDQRGCQIEPPAHAAGVGLDRATTGVGETELLQ